MMELTTKEMMETEGGVKITLGVVAVIAGITSFLLGVLDGINNPQSCHK